MNDDDDCHDSVLARDLQTMLERRRILRWMAALGLGSVVGCGSDGSASGNDAGAKSTAGSGASGRGQGGSSAAGSAASASGSCSTIPEETEGPYPGDGSNGANALQLSGIVRSDVRSSLGSAIGEAAGVPLTIKLSVVDAKGSCAALRSQAMQSISGTATATATTRCTREAPSPRTTCAACKRPTVTAW